MFLLGLICHLHHLLNSLPCTLNAVKVVVAIAILEENVVNLELDVFYWWQTEGSDKGSRQYTHYRWSNHISEKCWEKFGRPEWAQLADSDPHVPCNTPHVPSSAYPDSFDSFTVILSQEEYGRLRQLEFSQNNHSATHASSSGMRTDTASPQKL